ncbi:MAG: serine/threonine protein kinase [Polyangiaceae bacterium]|nr:serine/threonine protein kinase [Polyangiaceae bacterium]
MSDEPGLAPGTVLAARYRIEGTLGVGGMGRVYEAEHVHMKKRVAVKVLRPELTTVPEVVARFEREAMAAANIDHPNVAAATDFGKIETGEVYLVLELVRGRSLRDELTSGPLAPERALRVARQIAAALAAAHGLDIVHRDLKPENVMLVEKQGDPDFVKVLDFGIAKVPLAGSERPPASGVGSKHGTRGGLVVGTPEYMAPEQALGQAVDGRADLYALGVMLYEMLAGVRPFRAEASIGVLGQQLSQRPPSVLERAAVQVPAAAEAVALALLERDVAARPPSAAHVVAMLEAATREIGGLTSLVGGASDAGSGAWPVSSGPRATLGSGALGSAGRATLPSASASPEPPQTLGFGPSGADLGSSLPGHLVGAAVPVGELGQGTPAPGIAGAPPAAAAAIARVRRALDDLLDAIDRRKVRWPQPLPSIPAVGFLVAAVTLVIGAGAVLLVTFGAVGVAATMARRERGAASAATAASAEATAAASSLAGPTDGDLAAARERGAAGLAALAARYPRDAALQLEHARALRLERDSAGAVAAVGRAVELDATLADHKGVESVLWAAAQDAGGAEPAFTMLEGGRLGGAGADVIWRLATEDGVGAGAKARAQRFLGTDAFERQASSALRAASRLRAGKACSELAAAVLEAGLHGDSRSLPYLRRLERRTGCGRRGRSDCYPCLRGDARVAEAVRAVEKRAAR